ncbi:DUF4439 domain-containing protein [uncultured Jatrophihabitans sp.]|uniref:DUF4439 domain-containing protein n=1 Tax=uncultured Jatrophihabitans sp. TaxID=1610747 RepID=UPI0035C9B935
MSALDDAWQNALAAEHQAVFGYAVLGPRAGGAEALAVQCSDAHEALRNDTVDVIAAAGLTPVEPLADYPALYPVDDAAAARALAARLEDACAAGWRYLYLRAASTTGQRAAGLRTIAQAALIASAVRATRWRALSSPGSAATAFPGT